MQFVITGVHQRTAPLALREQLAFAPEELAAALRALNMHASEGCILSTCNRVEVYGVMDPAQAHELWRFLAEWHGVPPEDLLPHVFTLSGPDAVRHVFRLAAGLDSMVLGENQILGQIKSAMHAAQTAGMLGNMLHRLLQSALAVGKMVRTQTGIARTPVSVVSVAFDLVRQTLGGIAGQRFLVLGAGRMAELALKHLEDEATGGIRVASRTFERATALAERFSATAQSFDQLEHALRDSDVVISCTSAPGIVLPPDLIARATDGRSTPLLLLDLAVPRDIDRQAAGLPHVILRDIDDMQVIASQNRAARIAEIAKAEALVEAEVAKLGQWWSSQRVVPTIRALRERAEAIRTAELQRTLARLSELSPREQQAVEALSAAIVNKLLHQPITSLKDPHVGGDLAEAVQQLFQLS